MVSTPAEINPAVSHPAAIEPVAASAYWYVNCGIPGQVLRKYSAVGVKKSIS